MYPHTRKPRKSSGRASVLFAAISIVVGMAGEAAGQWKPMELASGHLDPISVFDSTVFGVGPAGLWRYLEKDRSWSCVRPRFRPNTLIQAGSRFFALGDDPASERGDFRSPEGGTTWESLLRGLGKADSLELLTARSAVFLGRYLVVVIGNAKRSEPHCRRYPGGVSQRRERRIRKLDLPGTRPRRAAWKLFTLQK